MEAAFAEHGLRLAQAPGQRLGGITALAHDGVTVWVYTGGWTYYGSYHGYAHATRDGNVRVFFAAAETSAVRAALAELH